MYFVYLGTLAPFGTDVAAFVVGAMIPVGMWIMNWIKKKVYRLFGKDTKQQSKVHGFFMRDTFQQDKVQNKIKTKETQLQKPDGRAYQKWKDEHQDELSTVEAHNYELWLKYNSKPKNK